MSIEKHAEASFKIKFDFDRSSTSADAGTGQLPSGVTIASAAVRVMKFAGSGWSDVSEQFIAADAGPALVDSSKAVEQLLKAAGSGEQPATRVPYVAICVATGSDGLPYVLLDNLEVVAAGRSG